MQIKVLGEVMNAFEATNGIWHRSNMGNAQWMLNRWDIHDNMVYVVDVQCLKVNMNNDIQSDYQHLPCDSLRYHFMIQVLKWTSLWIS